MTLTITIPDEIARSAEAIAEGSGRAPQDLLLETLRVHFPPVPPELAAELDAWNLASDEDSAKFEQPAEHQ